MLKTVSSLTPKEKFEQIGQAKAKEILKGVTDYTARTKLKAAAAGLGTRRVSLVNLTKQISRTQGASAASKFIRAAQKHFNEGVDPDIQKRYLKANMQKDLPPDFMKERHEINYAGGKLATGSVRAGEKGDMTKIGVSRGTVGFAGTNKPAGKSPSAPSAPAGGARPLGL